MQNKVYLLLIGNSDQNYKLNSTNTFTLSCDKKTRKED